MWLVERAGECEDAPARRCSRDLWRGAFANWRQGFEGSALTTAQVDGQSAQRASACLAVLHARFDASLSKYPINRAIARYQHCGRQSFEQLGVDGNCLSRPPNAKAARMLKAVGVWSVAYSNAERSAEAARRVVGIRSSQQEL
jgi:hypothetical protein